MSYGRLILRIGWAAKGLNPFKAYEEFKANERMSKAEMQELQNDLLRKMISHAYNNVPYYNDLFRQHKLVPGDIKSVADLPKVPVLTKDTCKKELRRMLANNVKPSEMIEGSTGGSTGRPLTFYSDKSFGALNVGGLWLWYTRCGWKIGEKIAMLWGFHASDWEMPWWKMRLREYFSRTCRADPYNLGEQQIAAIIKRFQKYQPKLLLGYPTAVTLLAKRCLQWGQRIEGLRGVYCSAEKLFDEQRNIMKEAFGCKVYDFYGCREIPHVSCECSRGSMHINSDYAIVELGEPIEGKDRPVILTGLHNFAMPMIRYQNGDICRDDPQVCECGLPFPAMNLAAARTSDMFKFANGRIVHGQYFTHITHVATGVRSFQYHQLSEDYIVLKVIQDENFGPKDSEVIEKVKRLVKEHSDGSTRIEVKFVDEIPVTRMSKHRFTISDVQI